MIDASSITIDRFLKNLIKLFINNHVLKFMSISNLVSSCLLFLIMGLSSVIWWGCESKVSVDHFDSKTWKRDQYGCNAHRKEIKKNFSAFKDAFIGLSENSIIAQLGEPNEIELLPRGQKKYTYYLYNAAKCSTEDSKSEYLLIIFNALGKAKHIILLADTAESTGNIKMWEYTWISEAESENTRIVAT